MNIVLEAQHAVEPKQPRGIGVYSIHMIRALLRRKRHNYALTFFDFRGENGNCLRAKNYFGEYNVPFHGCVDLDYRIAIREEYVYENRSYNYYTGADGDIFHFMNFNTIPTNLNGKMLVTVHDLNWLGYDVGTSAVVLPLLHKSFDRVKRTKPHIIADSFSTKNEILKFADIPESNIHVVHLSYDEDNMYVDKNKQSVTTLLGGKFDYLLYVGVFERKKNIVRIIKAFEQIAEKHKELRLVLAGRPATDDASSIFQTIEGSRFRDRIIIPGYIDTDTKRALYSNALGFVFPSICEGFGIPVLEAMACGCPVITAGNTSLPEVGGEAAIYVDAFDTEQLVFEIERLISSDTLRNNLRAKGFEQASKFSWDKAAGEVERVYEQIS